MGYREQVAEGPLGRWMECAWWLETASPVRGYAVRPDGCVDIVFQGGIGLQVVGAMTRERRHDFAAGSRTCGIRFHPGMAGTFLGAAPAEFTDRTVALADVWGRPARQLEERMAGAPSMDDCVRLLRGAFPPPERPPDSVQRAIEAMVAAHGGVDVDWAASQAGLSARQFRRRCLEEGGLAPKHLCRVLRFRRACALAGGGVDWAGVAALAGYFDQAHLIRDFHEFTGATPVAVFSKTPAAAMG